MTILEVYDYESVCDGCKCNNDFTLKKTLKYDHTLDLKQIGKVYFLCRNCMTSTTCIQDIIKWNRKYHKESDMTIFGITKEEIQKHEIEINIIIVP